jgi:hypothetical protein
MPWITLQKEKGKDLSVLVDEGQPTRISLVLPPEQDNSDISWVESKVQEAFPDWDIKVGDWLRGEFGRESIGYFTVCQPNIFKEFATYKEAYSFKPSSPNIPIALLSGTNERREQEYIVCSPHHVANLITLGYAEIV